MRLEFSTMIEAPIEEVYDFHIDTENLNKILPPWIDMNIIELPEQLVVGSIIKFQVKRFGISLPWSVKINRLDRPKLFSAEVIHSPLHNFAHAHYFKAIDDKTTLLIDLIHFPLPFRPFSLIFWPFIKKDMKNIFKHRHRVTKEIIYSDISEKI